MIVGELIERLKLTPKNLEIFLKNGEALSDIDLVKHPHLNKNDDVILLIGSNGVRG